MQKLKNNKNKIVKLDIFNYFLNEKTDLKL